MKNIKDLTFYKNPTFVLVLILGVFFLKGVFLAAIFPIFGGQDESRHYNTVQYLAEPAEKNWELTESQAERDKDHIETYGFSDEIRQTAVATQTDVLRGDSFNTINFYDNVVQKNEADITSGLWKPYNYNLKPEVVGGSLYHIIASYIEKALGQSDIFIRFYALRIFSVLLGTFAILFAYFITKTVGFSKKHSLLLTAIIAFQPKLAMYFCNINYDVLLISMFFLFTLAGVLILKNGLHWKNVLLILAATFLAIQTKLTGYVLLIALLALFAYFLYQKVQTKKKNIRVAAYLLSTLAFVFLAVYLKKYLPTGGQTLPEIFSSIGDYLSKSLSFGRFGLTERTYWGTLGWTDSWLVDNAVELLKYLEIVALIGLGFLFFGKKPAPKYLPEKKYVIFFLLMVIGLQLEIRVADWNLFSHLGKIELGTPGRYFLPNLASHIILMFTGLGAIFSYLKREHYFEKSLFIGLIFMFSVSMYLIFNVIVFRFYL